MGARSTPTLEYGCGPYGRLGCQDGIRSDTVLTPIFALAIAYLRIESFRASLPFGAVALWILGQLAVLWPAQRAAAVPPAIATRSA